MENNNDIWNHPQRSTRNMRKRLKVKVYLHIAVDSGTNPNFAPPKWICLRKGHPRVWWLITIFSMKLYESIWHLQFQWIIGMQYATCSDPNSAFRAYPPEKLRLIYGHHFSRIFQVFFFSGRTSTSRSSSQPTGRSAGSHPQTLLKMG